MNRILRTFFKSFVGGESFPKFTPIWSFPKFTPIFNPTPGRAGFSGRAGGLKRDGPARQFSMAARPGPGPGRAGLARPRAGPFTCLGSHNRNSIVNLLDRYFFDPDT